MSNRAGLRRVRLVSFASGAALVACSAGGTADVRGSKVARSTIEQVASKQISDRFGGGTYKVTCPHDLAAKAGAAMKCVTAFPDGEKFVGTAKVTSVSGGKVHWAYEG